MDSQNGWPVLNAGSKKLHTWDIPARNGHFSLTLREGSAGFNLAVFALWFAERVQDVTVGPLDDWGWAPLRNVREGSMISNHCSGTAMDLNATAHGLAKSGTFTSAQERAIHYRLRMQRGVIRWGGDYQHRKDEMHFEIVQNLAEAEAVARRMIRLRQPRALRVLNTNQGQRPIIFS